MAVTVPTKATITLTSACRAARCGRLATWEPKAPINSAIILLGVRPRRKTPIIGTPIYTAMAITTNSPSIAVNRISASTASLTT